MFFVFCFSTVLGLINLQLWECFFSLHLSEFSFIAYLFGVNRIFQYGLASWLPWSSALTPKRKGSQTNMDRWWMDALGLGSTCHCHQQQWCCSPSGICSSRADLHLSTWGESSDTAGHGASLSWEGTKSWCWRRTCYPEALAQWDYSSLLLIVGWMCSCNWLCITEQNICLLHKEHGQCSFVLL